MKSSDSSPLDMEFLETLRRQVAEGAPASAKARIAERLNRSLGAAAAPRGSDSPATNAVMRRARLSSRLGALAVRPIPFGVSALALGGVMGAVLHAHFASHKERIVYIDHVVQTGWPAVAQPPPDAASVPREDGNDGIKHAESGAAVASAEGGQGAERVLIDRARRAYGAGDYTEAERLLDRHVRRFPSGVLREEREALGIKVLVATARYVDARRRAVAFRDRFPTSLFGPAVEDAVKLIP